MAFGFGPHMCGMGIVIVLIDFKGLLNQYKGYPFSSNIFVSRDFLVGHNLPPMYSCVRVCRIYSLVYLLSSSGGGSSESEYRNCLRWV